MSGYIDFERIHIPHSHFWFNVSITLVSDEILEIPFFCSIREQNSFWKGIWSYPFVYFQVLQTFSKSKSVLWYVDWDRIHVPVSFQLWRLPNWLLVWYLRELCLIHFRNKKAFEKLWGLTHAWIYQSFRGIQKKSYCYATSL